VLPTGTDRAEAAVGAYTDYEYVTVRATREGGRMVLSCASCKWHEIVLMDDGEIGRDEPANEMLGSGWRKASAFQRDVNFVLGSSSTTAAPTGPRERVTTVTTSSVDFTLESPWDNVAGIVETRTPHSHGPGGWLLVPLLTAACVGGGAALVGTQDGTAWDAGGYVLIGIGVITGVKGLVELVFFREEMRSHYPRPTQWHPRTGS